MRQVKSINILIARKIFTLAMHCTLSSLVLWSLYEETFSGFLFLSSKTSDQLGKTPLLPILQYHHNLLIIIIKGYQVFMIYRWFVCLLILIKWYLVFMIYRCFVCLHSAPRSSNSSLCTIYYHMHMHKMKIIQLIIDNIVYICLTFLHCVFSNVSKSGHTAAAEVWVSKGPLSPIYWLIDISDYWQGTLLLALIFTRRHHPPHRLRHHHHHHHQSP